MCIVYVVASQKGGVAKTTSVENMGVGLARKGFKVLLIDADPQGSLTSCLGYKQPDSIDVTLTSIIKREVNEEEYDPNTYGIIHHQEGVDLLPSNIELSGMEISLINVLSRELVLRRYIDKIRDRYDFIIIDSMPSLGLMTINVLAAADKVIIPVQASYLSLKGLEQLTKTIGKIRRSVNSGLEITGILITMLDNRTVFAREVIELLTEHFQNSLHIYNTRIPFSIRVVESNAEGKSIFIHDPKGKVAEAYGRFIEEVCSNDKV